MADELTLKKLPYGISDFRDFFVKDLYYVDKSRFIRNIEEKGSFLFIIRPRRFGKSLFLSMMEYYYDIFHKDKFDELFKGTDIHKNPTPEKNNYMVLKFNFSEIFPEIMQVNDSFVFYVKETVINFVEKYEKYLDINIKEAKTEISARTNASDVLRVFLKYCSGKKYKLYIIIDEYDNFANTILSSSGEDIFKQITHGEGFLRAFFNVIKAGTTGSDTPISRLFMTGVSPITLDDVTSGFNIATNISLDNDIDEIMGFNSAEVETLIDYYSQTGKIIHSKRELMDILERWYSHYRFSLNSIHEVFNTVHVWYFFREYLKESFIPTDLIDRNARIDYNKLRHLIIIDKKGILNTNGNFSRLQEIIEKNSVQSYIKEGFSVLQLSEQENFYSLLYYFGLLTITGTSLSRQAILSIPNEFVKRLYYDFLKETLQEVYSFNIDMSSFYKLYEEMAFHGKWQGLIGYIGERMQQSLSLRDLMHEEKTHQVFWNAYLGLSTLYNIHSEKEMNQGYADLVMEPLLFQNPGIKYSYIIEIKYIKPTEFEKYEKEVWETKILDIRKEGKTQLNKYSADEKFMKSIGQTTLKKLILVFSGNRLVFHSEES